MGDHWFRGEAVGIAPARPGGHLHDFGDGIYLTDSQQVAQQYATTRAGADTGRARVLHLRVDFTRLRVLDLRVDARWQSYMNSLGPGRLEAVIRGANENYSRVFQAFVQQNRIDLRQYDAVVGREYVRGGNQLCILHKEGRLSPLGQRVRETLRPITVPAAVVNTQRATRVARAARAARGAMRGMGRGVVRGVMGAAVGLAMMEVRRWAEDHYVKSQLEALEPRIADAIAGHRVEIAQLILNHREAFANVTLEFETVTYREPEVIGTVTQQCMPEVHLLGVAISPSNINHSGASTRSGSYMMRIDSMPCTYSESVSLLESDLLEYEGLRQELHAVESGAPQWGTSQRATREAMRGRDDVLALVERWANPDRGFEYLSR